MDIDDFVFNQAIPKIEKKIPNYNYTGKFEFEVNLPNKEITEMVFNYYKNFSRGIKEKNYDYILPYLISDTQILLKMRILYDIMIKILLKMMYIIHLNV